MAAEIPSFPPPSCLCFPRFNEAAANGRGNLDQPEAPAAEPPASMRPRRMAAEIWCTSSRPARPHVASMRPRRMAAEIAGDEGGNAAATPLQ